MGGIDPAHEPENFRLGRLEISARRGLFERQDVPSAPALRMTERLPSCRVHSEVITFPVVDRTGSAPFPASSLRQAGDALSIICGYLRARKEYGASRSGKIK